MIPEMKGATIDESLDDVIGRVQRLSSWQLPIAMAHFVCTS